MTENFNVFDFVLAQDDMDRLENLTTIDEMRICVSNYERMY